MLVAARLIRRGRAAAGAAGSLAGLGEAQHCISGIASSAAPKDDSWVLVQRDGGNSTTAAGSASGAPPKATAALCFSLWNVLHGNQVQEMLSRAKHPVAFPRCRHSAAEAAVCWRRRRQRRCRAAGARLFSAPPAPDCCVAAAGYTDACGLPRLCGSRILAEHAMAGGASLRWLR